MEKERQTYEASPFSFLPLLIIILKTHHYEKCRLTENHLYEYADCTSTYRYAGKFAQKLNLSRSALFEYLNFLRKDLMLEILYSCYSRHTTMERRISAP